jgi:hypothetical protein
MSRPDFLEPIPVPRQVGSILAKRKLEEAFGQGMHDCARYGQEIPPDFFKTNRGHNAYPSRNTCNKNTADY